MKKIANILLSIVFLASAAMAVSAFTEGDFLDAARFAVVPVVILIVTGGFKRMPAFMAVVTTLTGFAETDNQTFTAKGRKALTQIYEATSIPLFKKGAAVQYFCYAQLTGAMTINAATTLANLSQFDEIVFFFDTDGTQRIVTFGTGFLSSGTVTIPANKGATVRAVFDGTDIRITSREIYA